MSGADLSPAAVAERLRQQSRASDLSRGRLAYKVDMSAEGVSRRLRVQSQLRSACSRWTRLGKAVRRGEPASP